MVWGTVTIGGVTFREDVNVTDNPTGLLVTGQDSHPPQLKAAVEGAHHNIVAMRGLTVPVVFTHKAALSGFYKVTDTSSALEWRFQGRHAVATWGITLQRVGAGRDVEVESHVDRIARPDDLPGAQSPVYWHAPAVGHTSYYTGSSSPSGFIDRAGEDGTVRVYTGLPTDVPRWTISADDYMGGAARISFDTIRRIGDLTPAAAVWEISNGLVKVTPGPSGAITVACWDDSAYRSAATWEFTVNGVPLAAQPELTITQNLPEEVLVRLTYPATPGRVIVDLSLRRGARFVTGTIKRHSTATLGLGETGAAGSTAVTGGLQQTDPDADGNRFLAGSASNTTVDAANAGLSLASALWLDFFLGHERAAAPAGDTYGDMLGQYLGSAGERVRIVRR